MDAEPLAQAATPDADMTIDYDQPPQPAESATDADMGVEAGESLTAVPSGAEVDVEAEMRDEGDYVPEIEIATDEAVAAEAPTAEAEEVAFEDIPTTESVTTVPADGAATADVSFTTVEEAMASALAPAPVESTASAAPGALTMPDSAPSATLAPEPSVSSAPEVPIPDEIPATEVVEEAPAAIQEISAMSDLHTTVGDGGAAARDLEAPAGPAGQAASADSGQAAAGEPAPAEAPQLSEPAPAAPEEAATATEAPEEGEPASGPVPPLFALATEKLAEQVEEAHSHSHDATEASASNARPAVEKEPLEAVELPADFAPGLSTSSARLAPGVLLTCGGTTYCLFRQLRVASETSSVEEEGGLGGEDEDARGPSDGAEEDAPMILGETSEHGLYYEPVERVLESLRKLLPEVDGEADELVLDFEDLGITLGEVSFRALPFEALLKNTNETAAAARRTTSTAARSRSSTLTGCTWAARSRAGCTSASTPSRGSRAASTPLRSTSRASMRRMKGTTARKERWSTEKTKTKQASRTTTTAPIRSCRPCRAPMTPRRRRRMARTRQKTAIQKTDERENPPPETAERSTIPTLTSRARSRNSTRTT